MKAAVLEVPLAAAFRYCSGAWVTTVATEPSLLLTELDVRGAGHDARRGVVWFVVTGDLLDEVPDGVEAPRYAQRELVRLLRDRHRAAQEAHDG